KINFDKELTIIIGNNGVGKTSILNAIRKHIMWIAASIRKDNASGGTISPDEINNKSSDNNNGAYIDCAFNIGSKNTVRGRIARVKDTSTIPLKSELTNYREIGQKIRDLNEYRDTNFPLFAFYGIDRLSSKKNLSSDLVFNKVDGYEESLNKVSNFNIFLEWLIQILKMSEGILSEQQEYLLHDLKALELGGANNSSSPLHPMYLKLKKSFEDQTSQQFNHNTNKLLEIINSVYRQIYQDFIRLELVNNDDGKDKVRMVLKDDSLFLHQLSDGQRVFLGMIGDIARRLILLNDSSDNPLMGQGIIIIDEVELHLHPKWQQKIIGVLRKCFPNIQFIVSTHSPQILGEVESKHLRILTLQDTREIKVTIPEQSYGLTSSEIVEELMGGNGRNQDIKKKIDHIFKLIDQENLVEAENKIEELQSELNGEIPELIEAKSLILMMK
ncbi:AAA family ATPase, partial [Acinetobacter baumannii]